MTHAPSVGRCSIAIVTCGVILLGASRLAAQGASVFVPLDDGLMTYVEHLIRSGVIRDPDPLTRPLRRNAIATALAHADTAHASAAVRATVRELTRVLSPRDAEPDFRARFYGGPYASTYSRRDPLRAVGPAETTFRAGMHLTGTFGPIVISQHIIDDPGIRHDPDYIGRVDSEVPFSVLLTDAYASLQGHFGEAFLGTMSRNWGPTGVDGEMVSPEPYTYTHLMGRLGGDALRLEGLVTQLDPLNQATGAPLNRYWATHRIFLRPARWISLVFTQGSLWYGPGRDLEFRWLNPLQLSAVTRINENLVDSVKSMHGGEVYLLLPRHAVFQGTFLVADFNNPLVSGTAKFAPDRLLGTAVLDVPVSGDLALRCLFTGVSNLMYRSPAGPAKSIMLSGIGLGRNFADYTQLTLSASALIGPMVVLAPELTILTQGQGDFRQPWPGDANSHPFLYDGIVEHTTRVALTGRLELGKHLDLSGDAGVHFVTNDQHVTGADVTRLVARFQLQYQLTIRIPLQ